ncbi:hypothetical protein D9613_012787 [Agrocybe pediades]|uniref:Uncharacterized protein n=1 Tax=Agrocybe pediades TaxID=84607 RepID=A0A8H4R3K6_9AGAR|nr:hypothetical protein D9613_012787 [Agrocybe pediades]
MPYSLSNAKFSDSEVARAHGASSDPKKIPQGPDSSDSDSESGSIQIPGSPLAKSFSEVVVPRNLRSNFGTEETSTPAQREESVPPRNQGQQYSTPTGEGWTTVVRKGGKKRAKSLEISHTDKISSNIFEDNENLDCTPIATSSKNKGKGIDPREWGNLSTDEDFDLEGQRKALESFEKEKTPEPFGLSEQIFKKLEEQMNEKIAQLQSLQQAENRIAELESNLAELISALKTSEDRKAKTKPRVEPKVKLEEKSDSSESEYSRPKREPKTKRGQSLRKSAEPIDQIAPNSYLGYAFAALPGKGKTRSEITAVISESETDDYQSRSEPSSENDERKETRRLEKDIRVERYIRNKCLNRPDHIWVMGILERSYMSIEGRRVRFEYALEGEMNGEFTILARWGDSPNERCSLTISSELLEDPSFVPYTYVADALGAKGFNMVKMGYAIDRRYQILLENHMAPDLVPYKGHRIEVRRVTEKDGVQFLHVADWSLDLTYMVEFCHLQDRRVNPIAHLEQAQREDNARVWTHLSHEYTIFETRDRRDAMVSSIGSNWGEYELELYPNYIRVKFRSNDSIRPQDGSAPRPAGRLAAIPCKTPIGKRLAALVEEKLMKWPYANMVDKTLSRGQMGDVLAKQAAHILRQNVPYHGDDLQDPDIWRKDRFLLYPVSDGEYVITDSLWDGDDILVQRGDLETPSFEVSKWYEQTRRQQMGVVEEVSPDDWFGYMGYALEEGCLSALRDWSKEPFDDPEKGLIKDLADMTPEGIRVQTEMFGFIQTETVPLTLCRNPLFNMAMTQGRIATTMMMMIEESITVLK